MKSQDVFFFLLAAANPLSPYLDRRIQPRSAKFAHEHHIEMRKKKEKKKKKRNSKHLTSLKVHAHITTMDNTILVRSRSSYSDKAAAMKLNLKV